MKVLDSLYNDMYNLENIQKFADADWECAKISWGISQRLRSELKSFLSFEEQQQKNKVYIKDASFLIGFKQNGTGR